MCALLAALPAASFALAADEPKGQVILDPPRERPQPGSVRLTNGLILKGLCSRSSSIAPVDAGVLDQRLELWLIDQGARQVFVSRRRCEPAVFNNLDWPAITFQIPQPKNRREPFPRGIPVMGPFDTNGVAQGKIHLVNGGTQDVTVGITQLNEMFAEVVSQTHDWSYKVAFDAIPRQALIPGLLERVDGYNTEPVRRLELARMLILADRLPEAWTLLQTLATDFPQLAAEQAEYQQSVRESLARYFTDMILERRLSGQHRQAAHSARLHPRDNLTPEAVVRVGQIIRDYEALDARITSARNRMFELTALLEDEQRRSLMPIVSEAAAQLDADSIDRFATFELNLPADGAPVEEPDGLLALAISGWLLGAEAAFRNLPEALALCEARWIVRDYLTTDPAESDTRSRMTTELQALEGLSVERLAALVRLLPSPDAIRHEIVPDGQPAGFRLAPQPGIAGAIGMVPPEYHETRQYPLIIAFPSGLADLETSLAWWTIEAARTGCIVVVPDLSDPVEPDAAAAPSDAAPPRVLWNASADQHSRVLALIRRLKLGLRIDDDRVFVAGHANGGEAAMDMATSHPDLFAGVLSFSSTGRRHLQWTTGNAIEVPWYVVIGDGQSQWFEQMQFVSTKLFRRDDDHKRFPDVLFIKYPNRAAEPYYEEADDAFRWIALHSRVRYPEKIHAGILRSTDRDWYWLQVDRVPDAFHWLDPPTTASDEGFKPATLEARRSTQNLIVLTRTPGDVTLFLSPEIPGLDLTKPLLIDHGRNKLRVDWKPELTHLLERLYETGDRARLCHMRITVPDR
jgi:pimeloyl-ACP methyl ester carboxylesterase